MSDLLLAVAEGDFAFDFDELVRSAIEVWPGTQFFPAHGRLTVASYGQLEFLPQTADYGLIVGLLSGGQGMGVEGPLHDAAAFVAWLTNQPWYPTSAVIMLIGTTTEPEVLRPGMEAQEIIQTHSE